MIEIRKISKTFYDTDLSGRGEARNAKTVLEDISMRFEPGKINIVIGASGSGKSVLFKCMLGLIPPGEGEVYYDGEEFYHLSEPEKRNIRKDIGMLFQGGALFDFMTVEENVGFPLRMFTRKSHFEIRERVDFCLSRVRLENVNSLYPSEISGGMKKRVGIARAIALNPRYLFCDEPNSGLDPLTAIVIDDLIRELTYEYKMTTIINTHDMHSVLEIGDNIMLLFNGRKHWSGNRQEIKESQDEVLNKFVFATHR